MSAVKKRKLNSSAGAAPLSALAARRAKSQISPPPAGSIASEDVIPLSSSGSSTPAARNGQLDETSLASTGLAVESTVQSETTTTPLRFDDKATLEESRAASPDAVLQQRSITFSTFKPDKSNFKERSDGTILLRLKPGERLVILGQFDFTVRKGQVTLLGSVLSTSKATHRVCALSSHSLPVIRCAASETDSAELLLRQCQTGLESLNSLSSLFGSLWHHHPEPSTSQGASRKDKKMGSSFKILFTSKDAPSKAYLQPLVSPPEWNAALSRLTDSKGKETPSYMLCGPKSSGKSTFAKILGNRLLSTSHSSKGIVILDIDPGQPEYSPPGHLSLIHITEPNFGPPFCHPIPSPKSKIIRSHSISAITPSMDPSLYMACALDLFSHYRNFLQSNPSCPLIINTPGWVFGTGLEILVELIAKINPTEVVYMSLDGPSEVVDSLCEAAKSSDLLTLPSQGSEFATRTAGHLRTMQNMSYFHLNPQSRDQETLSWHGTPLSTIRPWQVGYSGEEAGIMGVLCLGEQPPANLLGETINGSLVSVVVIEDMSALPFEDQNGLDESNEEDCADLHILERSTFNPAHLEKPLLVQTPEGIPYFNPVNNISVDPTYSHAIGLALIRGIDVGRKCIQIITPIAPETLQRVAMDEKRIMLVSGKLDTPGWAYTESFSLAAHQEKQRKRAGESSGEQEGEVEGDLGSSSDGESEQDQDYGGVVAGNFTDAPWVQALHGSQGRGVGSRVWRVRRDLGKSEGD